MIHFQLFKEDNVTHLKGFLCLIITSPFPPSSHAINLAPGKLLVVKLFAVKKIVREIYVAYSYSWFFQIFTNTSYKIQ